MTEFDPNAPLGTPANPRWCNVAPPPFHRGPSLIHGRKLSSWSEYRQANKEMGLVDVGTKPRHPDKYETEYSPKRATVVPEEYPRPRMLTDRT